MRGGKFKVNTISASVVNICDLLEGQFDPFESNGDALNCWDSLEMLKIVIEDWELKIKSCQENRPNSGNLNNAWEWLVIELKSRIDYSYKSTQ